VLLGLSKSSLRALKLVTYEALADDDDVWNLIHDQTYTTAEQREATLQVFDLLRHGRLSQAKARAELYAHKAELAAEAPEALMMAVDKGTATDEICDLGTLDAKELKHRLGNASYADWLLYLHAQQQKHVDPEHKGAARLIGVSGSGKTCVLVHRANTLAKRYPGEKILILVLNASLQYLIKNLVERLCLPEQQKQIQVERIHNFCYSAVKRFRPKAQIEEYDRFSREDLADCWRDFSRKDHATRIAEPLLHPLRLHDVEPWAYLHDELIWIRTGFGMTAENREAYLSCERVGRGILFPRSDADSTRLDRSRTSTGFPADTRRRVLMLLAEYEEWMREGGLLDEDGVALLAYDIRHLIPTHSELKARCVLIDEVQDCSTTQLAVISSIPTDERDGLFLVGDPVQKVFPRQQHLPSAGIDIRGRSAYLTTNYRNTRQILEAAYQFIASFRGKSPVPDDEILNPEFAYRDGPRPKLVQCSSKAQQYQCVEAMIQLIRADGDATVCVASPSPETAKAKKPPKGQKRPKPIHLDHSLAAICNENKWPVKSLADDVTLDDLQAAVIGARFEDMKGFEFRGVFLVDLMDKTLLSNAIPRDEVWRIAFQLYVAMTRAQEELWLFTVGEPSKLLDPLLQHVDRLTPADVIGS